MDINEYIINDVKPLQITDAITVSQNIFSQMTYSHLPVMENDAYIGCVSENDAHCFESDCTLKDVKYALDSFYVKTDTHWLDVLEAFAQHDCNVMPVLDEKNKYLGYYELKDILQLFNDSPFLYESGAVIVLEKGTGDYSFSEITQIVETNESKLFGCFISGYNEHMTQITIKVSASNVNQVLQTFRRYNYQVISAAQEDSYLDNLKERSDYLNKYLNM